MHPTLRIRPATAADRDVLIAHINAAYAIAEPFMDGPRTDPERLSAAMEQGVFLLAEDESGRLVASVYLELRGTRGYIGMLAVTPAQQRSGIGRRMMQAAEDHFRAHHCTDVDLTVLSVRTELPPIYLSYGFEITGAEPFVYPHPLKDGLKKPPDRHVQSDLTCPPDSSRFHLDGGIYTVYHSLYGV